MSTSAEQNKQNAMAFYDLMFNECRPREAIERHVGDQYIQHNPEVGDGKEAFIDLLRADGVAIPRQVCRVQALDR